MPPNIGMVRSVADVVPAVQKTARSGVLAYDMPTTDKQQYINSHLYDETTRKIGV